MKTFLVLLLALAIALLSLGVTQPVAADDGKSPGADLAVVSLKAPYVVVPGQSFTVAWTVTNKGTQRAWQGWADELYLSTDPILDASDSLLATHTHDELGEGASYSPSIQVSLPSTSFPLSKSDPPVITPPYFPAVQYLILHTGCGYSEQNTANNIYAVAIKVKTLMAPQSP
ncbi:MAG: hypothetical protein KIT87_11930 [Anaerolineae bacterium]|nr:hypothetical protein [Anaerolineae bacterium]